jgi:lysophospholipase L1-like esterase
MRKRAMQKTIQAIQGTLHLPKRTKTPGNSMLCLLGAGALVLQNAHGGALGDSADLDIHRLAHRERIEALGKNFETEDRQDALAHLRTDRLLPAQREALLIHLVERSSRADALQLLDALGPRDSRPISARIAALRALAEMQDPESLEALMAVFFRSRFDDLPEDPDLFERAIRIVHRIATENPGSVKPFLRDSLPGILCRAVISQLRKDWPLSAEADQALATWEEENPSEFSIAENAIRSSAVAGWEKDGLEWIAAMQSQKGSVSYELANVGRFALAGQWDRHHLLNQVAKDIRTSHGLLSPPPQPAPPTLKPGWHQELPKPTAADVELLRFKRTSPSGGLLLGGLGCLGIGFFLRKRPLASRPLLLLSGLFIAEGGMRAAGVESLTETQPLFSFQDWQYEGFEEVQREGGLWQIARGGPSRWEELSPHKTQDGLRIFVLGASSAHGSNHLAEESFSKRIEHRLQKEDPEREIHVVNMGIGGTTSNGVLFAGKQALAHEADGIVIYYGHNEAAQFSHLSLYKNTSADLLWWRMRLSQSTVYSALFRLLGRGAIQSTHGSIYAETEPTSDEREELLALAETNYRHNLGQLLRLAEESGTESLVINVVPNYRLVELQGDAAVKRKEEAERLSAEGRHIAAREMYQRAIEESPRLTTVTAAIREATLDTARGSAASYIDAMDIFYGGSQDGLTANGLFWDELHPSVEGQHYIAEAVLPWAREVARKEQP